MRSCAKRKPCTWSFIINQVLLLYTTTTTDKDITTDDVYIAIADLETTTKKVGVKPARVKIKSAKILKRKG